VFLNSFKERVRNGGSWDDLLGIMENNNSYIEKSRRKDKLSSENNQSYCQKKKDNGKKPKEIRCLECGGVHYRNKCPWALVKILNRQ